MAAHLAVAELGEADPAHIGYVFAELTSRQTEAIDRGAARLELIAELIAHIEHAHRVRRHEFAPFWDMVTAQMLGSEPGEALADTQGPALAFGGSGSDITVPDPPTAGDAAEASEAGAPRPQAAVADGPAFAVQLEEFSLGPIPAFGFPLAGTHVDASGDDPDDDDGSDPPLLVIGSPVAGRRGEPTRLPRPASPAEDAPTAAVSAPAVELARATPPYAVMQLLLAEQQQRVRAHELAVSQLLAGERSCEAMGVELVWSGWGGGVGEFLSGGAEARAHVARACGADGPPHGSMLCALALLILQCRWARALPLARALRTSGQLDLTPTPSPFEVGAAEAQLFARACELAPPPRVELGFRGAELCVGGQAAHTFRAAHVPILCAAVPQWADLRTVRLRACDAGTLTPLVGALATQRPELADLIIEQCFTTRMGLSSGVASVDHLLDVSSSNLSVGSAAAAPLPIVCQLARCAQLRGLRLEEMAMAEADVGVLARALGADGSSGYGRLTALSLVDCNVNSGACVALANALRRNRRLCELSLRSNPITDAGVCVLAAALCARNRTLRALDLSRVFVTDACVPALEDMLGAGSALQLLDLRHARGDLPVEQLSAAGVERLREAWGDRGGSCLLDQHAQAVPTEKVALLAP